MTIEGTEMGREKQKTIFVMELLVSLLMGVAMCIFFWGVLSFALSYNSATQSFSMMEGMDVLDMVDWLVWMFIGSSVLYFCMALVYLPIVLMTYLPVFISVRKYGVNFISVFITATCLLLCILAGGYEYYDWYDLDSEQAEWLRLFSVFGSIGVFTGVIHLRNYSVEWQGER